MKIWLYPFALCFVLFACKEKEKPKETNTTISPSSEIHLIPQFNNQPIQLEEIFTSNQGYDIKLTNFQILGTQLRNSGQLFADAFMLNYGSGTTLLSLTNKFYSGFDSLWFNVGVPETLNHADPTLPAADSPLNIANVDGMHWGWNPGYIFVKIEGRIDTLADGVENFDKTFSYHLGGDTLFRTTSPIKLSWMEYSANKFRSNLYFDFSVFFDESNDPLNVKSESFTHSALSQNEFNQRLMDKVLRSIH